MPIVINGSGTVTGISVGGLPDGIVDTDMLAATAVTGAKMGALPGGLWKGDGTGMTISNNTETKLNMFSTAKWTNGSMSWDDSNHRISFPLAGVYAIYTKLTAGNETTFGSNSYLIYKINGSIAHDSNEQMGFGPGTAPGFSQWYKSIYMHQFVEVSASDYIEAYFKHDKGSDVSISGDYSYIMIQYMGGA